MNHNPDDLLTPSDAARVLGLSADSVRVLSDNGRLPSMRTVSGRRLFRRSDVDRLAIQRAQSLTGGHGGGGSDSGVSGGMSLDPARENTGHPGDVYTEKHAARCTEQRAVQDGRPRNGASGGDGALGRLLTALRAARQGDFSVRLALRSGAPERHERQERQ